MGRGNDSVDVGDLGTGGDVTINNGAGDADEVETMGIANSQVGGSLAINGGSGTDFASVSFVDVMDNLVVLAGSGNDDVLITDTHVGTDALVRLGTGDDHLAWLVGQ